MRKITRRISAKVVTSYRCDVCKEKYDNPGFAKACEARKLEKKRFHLGQLVRAVMQRTCYGSIASGAKRYVAKGEVVKIHGPMLPDYDYEVRWLGAKRTDWHVFRYEIMFTCPHCHETKTSLYYGPELRAVKK